MGKPLIIVLVLLLIISVAAAFYAFRHKGSGTDVVKVSGNIEVTTVEVSFKVPGRVRERQVDEGEKVTSGQLVARLDN
ncbi:MAG TPA: hemolysin secretion protein D, partial [Geobacteraceae bacterium]|nr:hemolysin secretion protein D [Geobacteraceae bacterium]